MDDNEDNYGEDFENISDHDLGNELDNEFKDVKPGENYENLDDLENELLNFEEENANDKNSQKEKIEPNDLKKDANNNKSKPPKPKHSTPKKTEESNKISRQNSMNSNFSNKNASNSQKDKKTTLRSHSSRSRQEDILLAKDDNPYFHKIEFLIQEKDYTKLSQQQILQENNLLRLHLKNFNKELNTIIDRQALKPGNKPPVVNSNNKPASARMRTMLEEIKINNKKLNILKEEFAKYNKRLESISDGSYLVNLQTKIDNTKKILEDQKKNNKIILLDQKKHGKNLENIDSLGMPESLAKGNEISSLLPGLARKNQALKERNDMVLMQIEETEKKNQNIHDKYEKALQLADAYKLFRNDKKREQYEVTQLKVEVIEKNIHAISKKNEKVLEIHKKSMEDLLKCLKEKDEMIFAREKDLLISRQKIEELLLTEKINKDSLLKILPPTPKTNNMLASASKKNIDSSLENEEINRIWNNKEKNNKNSKDNTKNEGFISINDNKVNENNHKINQQEKHIEEKKEQIKDNNDDDHEKKIEQSPSKSSVGYHKNKEESKEDPDLNKKTEKNNDFAQKIEKNDSLKKLEKNESAKKTMEKNDFTQKTEKNEPTKTMEKNASTQKYEKTDLTQKTEKNDFSHVNEKNDEREKINEKETVQDSNLSREKEIIPIKTQEKEEKTFNFHKGDTKENKTFNFNKKITENTNLNLGQTAEKETVFGKVTTNKKIENGQTNFKKDRNFNIFNDNEQNSKVFNINEIKSIDNQDPKEDLIKNTHEETKGNQTNQNTSIAAKPKKIIADPFSEEKKENDKSFNNEFMDDGTVNTKKFKMGTKPKKDKIDYASKAENGENEFFGDGLLD